METRRSLLRHNFAIQLLGTEPGFFKARRYLYHCVHCKWTFLVNDADRCTITAVDSECRPLQPEDARLRLLTFDQGPCPVAADVENCKGRLVEEDSGAARPIRIKRSRRAGAHDEPRPALQLVQIRRPRRLEPDAG